MATGEDRAALPEYMLMESVGKGSFGIVFRALSKTRGSFVAVKKLGSKRDQMASLMSEIELLKSLSHKNIVKYIEHVATSGHVYLVMEFIENGSLCSLVKKYGILPEALVCNYTHQILEGLAYLHRQGVIHRDIKGANLLICTDGTIKLTDFGVSTRYDPKSKEDVAGTPNWMAPEVIQMQPATTACDVWSVGITVIELLTGNPPYIDLPQQAAIYKIVMEDHPPLPPGITSALEDFLLNCFKKDENLRATAEQLLVHAWIKSAARRQQALPGGATGLSDDQEGARAFEQTKEQIVKFNQQLQTVARRASISLPPGFVPPIPSAAAAAPTSGASDADTFSGLDIDALQLPRGRAVPKLAAPMRMEDEFADLSELDGPADDPLAGLELKTSTAHSLNLQVRAWDEEAEPAWDEGAFEETPKEMELERARQLLHKEIITHLNQLALANPEAAIDACNKLNDIFTAQPQETVVLVQPTVAVPFLKHLLKTELPMVSLFDLLRKCAGTKKLARTASAILRVLNTATRNYEDVLSVVSSLQAIPLIAEFSRSNYALETRIQAANFLCFLGSHSITSLQMLLASNGLESVMSLLLSQYSSARELCHIAIDTLWSVISKHSPTARAPLCHVLLRFNVTEVLINLLHSMVCGKEGFDDSHLTKGVETLLQLAAVDYLPLRRSLCTKHALEKMQELFKATRAPTSQTVVSFLLNLLKVVHHVSSNESIGDALEPLIDSLIPVLGVEIPAGHPKSRTSIEINNQVLHILYNLCALDATRAARAASAGVVPLIHRAIQEQWPMRELALPILFRLVRSSPRSRDLLWQSGSLQQCLGLLSDKSWYADACDSIGSWLRDDPQLLGPVLAEPASLEMIRSIFALHSHDRAFSKVVEPLTIISRSSSVVATSLIESGVIPEILELVQHEHTPYTRRKLLELMLSLYENAKLPQHAASPAPPQQQQPPVTPRATNLAIPAIEEIASNDTSEVVRSVARDILALLKRREDAGGSVRRSFLSFFRH